MKFHDEFFQSLDKSILPVETAVSLPPECYTDADFYAFEKEALFHREWLCLGRAEWVAERGDYFTTTIVDEPIICVRDREGVVRALSAVCQHRAMLVAEGAGNVKSFVCPYHHWSYALDGRLMAAPAMERTCAFNKDEARLPEFKVEIWQGFVFCNLDPAAAPLAPRLEALEPFLAPYDLANARGPRPGPAGVYPWNWKVMLENNNDGYHANKLHRGPLHDFVPSELATFPDLPSESAGFYRLNGTLHPDASFNPLQRALLPVFPKLNAEERHRMVFANIPPTLSLVLNADSVIYLILRATGPETMEMDQGALFAPGTMDLPNFDHLVQIGNAAVSEIVAQDLHVDKLVQVGLRSRYARRCRYSWQEGAQRQFNAWLVPRYQAAWARAKARANG